MDDCLFCRIVEGQIPADKVYEDEYVLAFRDIDPQAPQHVLIIPKKHFGSVMDMSDSDSLYLTAMIKAAQKIAKELNIDASGFRLVINTGSDGGQTVPHLHTHMLGGRALEWPPG